MPPVKLPPNVPAHQKNSPDWVRRYTNRRVIKNKLRAMVENDPAQLQRIMDLLKNNYHFNRNDLTEFASQDPDVRSDVQRALESIFNMLNISFDDIDEDEMEDEDKMKVGEVKRELGANQTCVTNPYIVAIKH